MHFFQNLGLKAVIVIEKMDLEINDDHSKGKNLRRNWWLKMNMKVGIALSTSLPESLHHYFELIALEGKTEACHNDLGCLYSVW